MSSWLIGNGKQFKPDTDIPDLSGKVILVTGGNTGLGQESIRQLVKHRPAKVFLAARSEQKAATAIAEIKKESPDANIVLVPLNLSSLASVAAAAKSVQSQTERLDILLNNAGIMNTPYSVTEDGYEIQFGTNHVGHALLTKLLTPLLLRTAEASSSDVRVVILSSAAHLFATFSGGVITSPQPWGSPTVESWWRSVRYGSSKLANLLFARELARQHPQITAVSLHPGTVDTQLFNDTYAVMRKIPLIGESVATRQRAGLTTVDQGTWNQLWCCTAPKQEVRQSYYFNPVGASSKGGLFTSEANARALWDWTEAELAKHGY